MNSMTTAHVLDSLNWRYATKSFDPTREIPEETWDGLEQALVLTPSSYGLQPWKFLVLRDRNLRERLVPHAWGQRQVVEASVLVVFSIRLNLGIAEIEAHLRRISEVRGTPLERLEGFRKMMVDTLVEGGMRPVINEWAARQSYIALGNFMTAAALVGVDTCPLEGFEPERFDEILDLKGRGWASVVCCAAGYRMADDRHGRLAKVRFRREDVVERR
ncbi:MAG: NAD(P)H-dependent oxidoreductase [Limisphaerales bacterium]